MIRKATARTALVSAFAAIGFAASGLAAFAAQAGHYNSEGVYLYPYGTKSTPTMPCSPDRVCEIILEPNEVVYDKVAGDTVRWVIGTGVAGASGRQTAIFFKPTDVGVQGDPIATNLIITTNKRTYEVRLEARSSVERTRYGFYYPQEAFSIGSVDAGTSSGGGMYGGTYGGSVGVPAGRGAPGATPAPGTDAVPPQLLDFGYHIYGDASYRPTAVWNDGTHTYVKMAPRAEAPSIYSQIASGQLQMVNYHPPINDLYTLDGVPEHLVLIGTVGKRVPHIDVQKDH